MVAARAIACAGERLCFPLLPLANGQVLARAVVVAASIAGLPLALRTCSVGITVTILMRASRAVFPFGL